MPQGTYLYGRHDDTHVLKLRGHLRYSGSPVLDSFIREYFARDDCTGKLLIDLTEIQGIDSTNLGLLARLAQLWQKKGLAEPSILSSRPDINRVLESVGFDQAFNIIKQDATGNIQFRDVKTATRHNVDVDQEKREEDLATTILEAHQALADLNEKNREVFANAISLMSRQKKTGAESKSNIPEPERDNPGKDNEGDRQP